MLEPDSDRQADGHHISNFNVVDFVIVHSRDTHQKIVPVLVISVSLINPEYLTLNNWRMIGHNGCYQHILMITLTEFQTAASTEVKVWVGKNTLCRV